MYTFAVYGKSACPHGQYNTRKKNHFLYIITPLGTAEYIQTTTKYNEDSVVVWLQIASPPVHTYLQCRGSAGNQYPGRMTPARGIGIEEDLN